MHSLHDLTFRFHLRKILGLFSCAALPLLFSDVIFLLFCLGVIICLCCIGVICAFSFAGIKVGFNGVHLSLNVVLAFAEGVITIVPDMGNPGKDRLFTHLVTAVTNVLTFACMFVNCCDGNIVGILTLKSVTVLRCVYKACEV